MNQLQDALSTLGQDQAARDAILAALLAAEKRLAKPDYDVRELVTGPIVDALFQPDESLTRTLKNGVTFHFRYRSKIARDFVMAKDANPDHVWEPQTTRLLMHFGKNARNAIVGGAYCGDQAILLAQTMKSHGGICHCFEPNSDQMETLQKNARANNLDNLRFRQLGLWDADNTKLVLVGNDSWAHVEEADEGTGESFQTITVNSYGKLEGIEHLDLIMLDIEGAEIGALRGAADYLAKPAGEAPVVVFEVHRDYVDWSQGLAKTEVGTLLTENGYTLYCVRDYQSNEPMGSKKIELVPAETAYLEGPSHGFNMLALKDTTLVTGEPSVFSIVANVSPKLLRHRNPALHQPVG
ncbi:MAG: FkbM family methyltransferase [Verrucomicrobiaceae bacterium]|nr:MAG: FkbM family methyltransferase [Verrucomicrobiaceae bacterium]